jgi:branched-chain amino acid transport system ATP-binding protein
VDETPRAKSEDEVDAPTELVRAPILEVSELRVSYGSFVGVDGVSFRCAPGSVTAIIGPNGSGKTSTLNALTGQVPARGSIILDGAEVSGSSPARMFELGVVRTFQNLDLIGERSARENVALGARSPCRATFLESLVWAPRMWKERRQCLSAADQALELLGLTDIGDLNADELPYGIRRRLEVARALIGSPKLLLLDEPTAGMGPAESRQFGDLLLSLARSLDLATLVIEHDMAVVRAVVDYVYVLDRGSVIAEGRPSVVLQSDDVRRVYLGADAEEALDAHP